MSSRDPSRGGQPRGRTPTRRERRLQQQNQTRQAIAEQRQQLAENVDINADPQEDVVVDRGGEGVTVRLTDSAEKQRLAKQFSQKTGADINPSDIQLTDDGAKLSAAAKDRIARQKIDDLRGDVHGSILAPPSGDAFSALIGTFRSELSSGRIENIGQFRQATDASLTADPVTAVKKANPDVVADVFGGRFTNPEQQVEEAQKEIKQRRQLLKNDPSKFLDTIQENQQAFSDAALSLESAFRRGQSRRHAARQAEDNIADEIADTKTDLSADQVSVDVDPQTGKVEKTAVSDEFKQEQRQEQRQKFRSNVAEQAGVSPSVIDVERNGDQLSANIDKQAFAAKVAKEEGVAPSAVTVEKRDGELAAVVETEKKTKQQQDTTDLHGGKFIDELPQSDLTVTEGDGPVLDPGGQKDEPTFPRDNINQTLVNQTTDSGGFLSENRSTSGGLIPSAIVTEEDTQALAETGQNIIDETQNADIDPATPAGALFTEASGVNLAEGVTRGVGQFVGGALAAPQAVETATEFAQNAPLKQESVDTASAVVQSATRSTVNQAVKDPVAFGTGIGLGVATGTAASRGVSAVGGRVSSVRQAVSMDFDGFRGSTRGQLDLTGRTRGDSDTDSSVVDDELLDEFESSSPSAGRSNIDVDPRRSQRAKRAGRRGEQRAIERDIEADTPDLEDRGQPSGQSAEVRSVDRPGSKSTQDLDVADAGRGADRVLDPDTSDFTATERLEARNIGRSLADPDFPRGVPRSSKAGLSENPVRAGRATTDTGPSAATVTDDVAAAATVTDAGEAASSARQPEGERVEERVSAEVTDQSGGGPSMLTGETGTPAPAATLFENLYRQSGSMTTATTTVGLDGAMSLDTSGFAASTSATGTASRLATNPFAAAQSGSGLGVDVGAGVNSGARGGLDLGVDLAGRVGVGSGGRSRVDTERGTQTATGTTTMVGASERRRTATNTREAATNTRSSMPTGFGSGFGGFGGIPGVPGGSGRRIDDPAPRGGAGVGDGNESGSGGVGDGGDFGVPQPGWFVEFLQARAFGGLAQRSVDQEAAQAASIGLGLPTERVAEAEGQEQQRLEQVAEQFGLDLFEDGSDDDDDNLSLI